MRIYSTIAAYLSRYCRNLINQRSILIYQHMQRMYRYIQYRFTPNNHHLIALFPIYFALAYQNKVFCNQVQIEEINKQELVHLMHRSQPQEFIIIIYNKFKKLNQKQFALELEPTIKECRKANIKKIYLIDSREKDHLDKILRILKNKHADAIKDDQQGGQNKKKKDVQCYFKSRSFNEAFQLSNNQQYPLGKEVSEIRHFEISINNPNIIDQVNTTFNSPLIHNRSTIVKECIAEGQCVQSYKRSIKSLIDSGMLVGKAQQFKFQLILDTPVGFLSKSSQFVKVFNKFVSQKSNKLPNKRQEMILFRKDLFGNETTLFSDWFQRQGNNYESYDRFMMFLKPRIHYISKNNTFSDLLWYFRTVKSHPTPSISLNNTDRWSKSNDHNTTSTLQILHSAFPKLNYLIINTDKVSELFRHLYGDEKYALFQQSSSPIWKKIFLNLDKLQKTEIVDKEALFNKQFKQKISSFILQPTLQSLVIVESQLEISYDKLKQLKQSQLNGKNAKSYIVRVCRQRCLRKLNKDSMKDSANVYWIDSLTQNLGIQDGNYLLSQGQLINLPPQTL